jgi:hypothetical protein
VIFYFWQQRAAVAALLAKPALVKASEVLTVLVRTTPLGCERRPIDALFGSWRQSKDKLGLLTLERPGDPGKALGAVRFDSGDLDAGVKLSVPVKGDGGLLVMLCGDVGKGDHCFGKQPFKAGGEGMSAAAIERVYAWAPLVGRGRAVYAPKSAVGDGLLRLFFEQLPARETSELRRKTLAALTALPPETPRGAAGQVTLTLLRQDRSMACAAPKLR